MVETTSKIPLSVIIPVKNEAINIRECIQSVSWADEIFVVDSQSTDKTCEIAQQLHAKVVQFHYDGGWPKKKNWALRNLPIRNEWILILDADERVTAELRDEIADAIKNPAVNGYYIRWKFIFLGRWMKHCWARGWMLRLIRKGFGEYEDIGMRGEGGWDNEVHENIVVRGKTGCLQSMLLHQSNQDTSYWIKKHNEFSTWSAANRLRELQEPIPHFGKFLFGDYLSKRKFLRAIYIRLPFKPLIRFFYLYVVEKGFLDGREGFYFCLLRASHELNIGIKVFEYKKNLHTARISEKQ